MATNGAPESGAQRAEGIGAGYQVVVADDDVLLR